jgi:divalent metal cation (Fe/Co/Zn/Cd) transporter
MAAMVPVMRSIVVRAMPVNRCTSLLLRPASTAARTTSGVTLIAAAVSLTVLTPLAYAKRCLGTQMASRALQGDGALSGVGAATSLLALTALVLYHTLGWW